MMDADAEPPDPPDISKTPIGTKRSAEPIAEHERNIKKMIVNREAASASIQNVFIHPSLVIGVKQYTAMDSGPFLVHVSRTEPDPAAGSTIRPIKFGQFLHINKIRNICPEGIKKVGRNKISIEFISSEDANRFLDNPILEVSKYKAEIPNYNISKMGIVRQVPVDLSMDEFAEFLVSPTGCGIVLKARRLNRKIIVEDKPSWVPTQTVVITFQGQTLPRKVFLFHTSLPVDPYEFPTIQCLNCCRFGHVKIQCRSKPRCYRCTQPHTGESCHIIETESSCLNCSGRHYSINKSCPEYARQKSIKLLMSQDNISYEEASSKFPKSSRSFAEVTQATNPSGLQPATYSQSSQSSPLLTQVSYRKTVTATPRHRPPLPKSYDRVAHQAIIAEEPSELPNGYALSQASKIASSPMEDNLLEVLMTMILNIILKSNTKLPSNVAQKLSQILSLSNNGSNPSMEFT